VKRTIFWHDRDRKGAEHCVLAAEPGGFRFEGTLISQAGGAPLIVQYAMRVDVNWHTRRVEVRVNGGGGKDTLILLADSYGGWWHDTHPLPELSGCIDVDLGMSPSTNTLPIRRLLLQPGHKQTIDVAWVRVPELTVERATQTYERIDAHRYRFETGKFAADLIVDKDGLVVDYAIWMAMATV
jgi:hypothetical protein